MRPPRVDDARCARCSVSRAQFSDRSSERAMLDSAVKIGILFRFSRTLVTISGEGEEWSVVFYSTTDTIHERGIYGRIFSRERPQRALVENSWHHQPREYSGWTDAESYRGNIFCTGWRASRRERIYMLEKIANYFDRFSMLPLHPSLPPLCGLCFPTNFPPIVRIFSCPEKRATKS